MPGDGGRATRVLADGYDAHAPTWSPDGTRLAFQAYHADTWHLWTMQADGSDLRQVTTGPYDDREPHWSPDGTRIAFASDRGGNYDVWLLTLATGEVRRFTSGAANESMPAWSPDGAEVAFVSDREGRGIYARHVDTGVERQLAADTAVLYTPSWSPDGKTVAYVAVDGASTRLMAGGKNLAAADEDVFPFRPSWISSSELLYTADGLTRRRSVTGGAARTVPFAADVAFSRDAYTPARRAFPEPGPQPVRGVMHPAISPDGSTIAFAALGDLWLVSTGDGERVPRRVTSDVFIDTNPVWSPDGATLAFSSDRDGAVGLWVHELKTGAARRLAPDATTASWSPDGSRLAYLDAQSSLRVVDVATREQRQVHQRIFEPGRPSWSPDGRAVVMAALRPYSTRFREGTNQVLWVAVEPRRHSRRARRLRAGSLDRSHPAHVGRHAREPRAGMVAGWPRHGRHRRRLPDHLSGRPRRRAHRSAAPHLDRTGQLAVVDRRLAPFALSDRRPAAPRRCGRRQQPRHRPRLDVDAPRRPRPRPPCTPAGCSTAAPMRPRRPTSISSSRATASSR